MEQQVVVTWDKAVQLFNDTLVFHFILILTKYTQLFQEVKNNEEQVRVVPVEHRHELTDDLVILELFTSFEFAVADHQPQPWPAAASSADP